MLSIHCPKTSELVRRITQLSVQKLPAPILVLCACMLAFYHVEGRTDTVTSKDSFCHDHGLEVIYPGLHIDNCLIIPKKFRNDISTVWNAPQIKFSNANVKKRYVLVMVDPDAPRHTTTYWRHWLVADIQGSSLKEGNLKGRTVTEYYRPTPPRGTGFHRYQFMLFEQPPHASVSLAEPRGNWNLNVFTQNVGLGPYVATQQFETENYNGTK